MNLFFGTAPLQIFHFLSILINTVRTANLQLIKVIINAAYAYLQRSLYIFVLLALSTKHVAIKGIVS
jgi:hypothetical protein